MTHIPVTNDLIKALDSLHLSLTHFYLLSTALTEFNKCSPICEQTLVRKNWIKDGKLTESGLLLYNSLIETFNEPIVNTPPDIKKALKQQKKAHYKASSEAFDRWWTAFPSTTTFIDSNDKKWEGGRSLKTDKEKCEQKFLLWLEKGADVDTMIKLIEWEVEKCHKQSIPTGENKMQYFPGSYKYLNSRNYEDMVAMYEIENKVGKKDEMEQIKNNINNDFI